MAYARVAAAAAEQDRIVQQEVEAIAAFRAAMTSATVLKVGLCFAPSVVAEASSISHFTSWHVCSLAMTQVYSMHAIGYAWSLYHA